MAATKEYFDFIGSVKERIRSAQYEALKAVNKELVGLYWDIGRMISEKQKELGWGKSVVENIAKDLKLEFPDQKGFSTRNLWLMMSYYSEYKDDIILQTVSAELSFSHNMAVISRCTTRNERIFYLTTAKKFGWSFRILDHQIDNKTYEKYLLNQTNYDDLLAEKFSNQKVLAIKDHYTFDFLELSEKHSERELETALIRNIQSFLLELGGDFSFMGSQYKLILGGEEFFIDLLLFHRELQCLVAIELKAGAFKPEYKGKMEFYLNVLNDFHRKPHENEAIGIIICKSKNRLVVEYSLKKSGLPIGIASYSTSAELPNYYEKVLPSFEQIERGLGFLNGDG
jgi:predicted nuclease of restriction endonuclease-like (RecB) superfamily